MAQLLADLAYPLLMLAGIAALFAVLGWLSPGRTDDEPPEPW